MFDTIESIRQQLAAGEDTFAEFKEVRLVGNAIVSPNTEQFAGELVALANAEGGCIFLGVDDTGVIQGVAKGSLDAVERWAVNIATNNCDPPIRPVIRKVRIPIGEDENAQILLVQVRRGLYVHRTTGGRWLLRVGSTKRDLTSQELARLLQQRGRAFVFDEQPVLSAAVDDLSDATLVEYFGRTKLPMDELLRNTRVAISDEEGLTRPTVAGLLVFGAQPQHHLASACIDAAVYRSTSLDSDDLVHSQRIDGTVVEQIDDAVAFVQRFMLMPARKDVGRQDFPQYALGAVHEAIVNAVAHRDYSISGSRIRLFLYSDRMEIYSPGGLPNTITLETLPYRVFTRNQLLVAFLSKLRSRRTGRALLESRGEGVRRILDESEAHSGRRPEYHLHGEEVELCIWAKPSPHAEAGSGGEGEAPSSSTDRDNPAAGCGGESGHG
ncbi:MAG: putative DNA binding domain-containing protein [Polyangiaceae bacterium]|nr:putative DNA binding domain-containing protein [Polyangiaceae bacterium]